MEIVKVFLYLQPAQYPEGADSDHESANVELRENDKDSGQMYDDLPFEDVINPQSSTSMENVKSSKSKGAYKYPIHKAVTTFR